MKPFGRLGVITSPGLDRLGERIGLAVSRRQAAIAHAVHERVVGATPVDTGKARSNWVVRRGRPFELVYRAFAPGRFLGRSETANRTQALRQAAAVLRGHNDDRAIYITNNVAYIGRLNDGYSRQAPANFVRRSVSQGVAELRGKRLIIR